jgi:RNA polymerase sigma-70 factor, ECF subfamily
MGGGGEITGLLAKWANGDNGAVDELVPLVYLELRRIADGYLRRERSGHTLQPTALVHEAWLRIANHDDFAFEHRKQFFALAAQAMRRILVDHARTAHAQKRGGGAKRTELKDAIALAIDHTEDLLALDEALGQLSKVSPRQAHVIEMRYFAGLNVQEMADMLGVSPATISREQKTAEAWLSQAMQG